MAILGPVCCLVYVGLVGNRRGDSITLPSPDGRYGVGRATFEWVDQSRRDPLASPPARGSGPVGLGVVSESSDGVDCPGGLPTWCMAGVAAEGAGRLLPGPGAQHRASRDVGRPLASGRFPIVVLEPGMGLSAPEFTSLAEDIASHGYLVAGVTPTYSANVTVLDGKVVTASAAGNPPELGSHSAAESAVADRVLAVWTADARFARTKVAELDRVAPFAGHVATGGTTYVGHSFGGAAALQACQDDPSCAGAVDLDGTQFGPVVRTGLSRPFMILGGDGSCVTGVCAPSGADEAADLAVARSFLTASSGPAWSFRLTRAEHFNFTDLAVWYIAPPLRWLYPLGGIDGDRGLRLADACTTSFVDHVNHGTPFAVGSACDESGIVGGQLR